MSDCYTTFYFELPIPSDELAKEVETFLTMGDGYWDMDADQKENALSDLDDVFTDFGECEDLGFEWATHLRKNDADGKVVATLEVYADEHGNVEHAANLIEWLLPKLDIKAAGFEFAQYGDGYNGGGAVACVMGGDGFVKTQWTNTAEWLMEKLR